MNSNQLIDNQANTIYDIPLIKTTDQANKKLNLSPHHLLDGLHYLATHRTQKNMMILILLGIFLFSSMFSAGYVASAAYTQYTTLKTLGTNGARELMAIKTLLSNAEKTADPSSGFEGKARAVLQPPVMIAVQNHAQVALSQFQQIAAMVDQRQGVLGIASVSPFASKVTELGAIAHIGIDTSQLTILLAQHSAAFAPLFQGSLLSSSGEPLVNTQLYSIIQTLLPEVQSYLTDIVNRLPEIQLKDLPLTPSQQQQIASLLPSLHTPLTVLSQVDQHLPAIGWLLGIGGQRSFLVQTLDRGELRPTGGFTGQFGIVTVNGGRVGPISLSDVMTFDSKFYGQVPAPYNMWWPFGWEVRDANISGNFATSAQYIMHEFAKETGQSVDGVMQISPLVIEHLLTPNLLGPITVPCYNYTVTADNLENALHYFQLGGGIALQTKCIQNPDTTLRKQFTSALSSQLQNLVRKASPTVQGKIIKSLLNDLESSNIEIYFSNADAEKALTQYGVDGSLIVSPTDDETAIVQANMGANKGSIYMNTHVSEQITLDSQGNAHHSLSISFDYKPPLDSSGNAIVFGIPTMRDYIRVYVPAGAQFVDGSGFDELTSQPYCYGFCQPPNRPTCQATAANPKGLFTPNSLNVVFPRLVGSAPGYFDAIGGPTNFTSDITNRTMFGGLVELPPFCSTTVALQWVVPHIAQYSSSHATVYVFTERHQSGTINDATVWVTPPSNDGKPQNIHETAMENNIVVRYGK